MNKGGEGRVRVRESVRVRAWVRVRVRVRWRVRGRGKVGETHLHDPLGMLGCQGVSDVNGEGVFVNPRLIKVLQLGVVIRPIRDIAIEVLHGRDMR